MFLWMELDLAELGFDGVEPEVTGRPSYHPSVLLKLSIYAYLNRIKWSRRLEREAQASPRSGGWWDRPLRNAAPRARPRSVLGQFASATGCRSDDPALQGWSAPQAQVQA